MVSAAAGAVRRRTALFGQVDFLARFQARHGWVTGGMAYGITSPALVRRADRRRAAG